MPDDTDAIRAAVTARLVALRRAAADHEALFNAAFAMGRLAGGIAELETMLGGFDQPTEARQAGDAEATAPEANGQHINGLAAVGAASDTEQRAEEA